jgi:hypothetical protein
MVAPVHDNHSDVQLIAGCGVGGIKEARLTTWLETGTGEPEIIEEFFTNAGKYGTDERTVESLT